MRYVTLKNQTWHYARNYPKDVSALLGRYKLKQSLKTADAKIAALRATIVNARCEKNVRSVRVGLKAVQGSETWTCGLRTTLTDIDLDAFDFGTRVQRALTVRELSKHDLSHKEHRLAPDAYKAFRYSVALAAFNFLAWASRGRSEWSIPALGTESKTD